MPACYILFSPKINKFYIGSTSGKVEDRLKKHLSNHSGFTGKVKDWVIVYAEDFDSIQLAHSRELEIKAWKSKSRIEALCKKQV